jgi:dTDP-4-dehydrorhamnose 3,5-epimerase-like enzyme
MALVKIMELQNSGRDMRGDSFTVPHEAITFVGKVQYIHVASIVPAATRGNHFHLRRKEALIISYGNPWTFYWDEGPGTQVQARNFSGAGAAVILIEPGSSHAVQNAGESPLLLYGLSSEPYHPSESVARRVSP